MSVMGDRQEGWQRILAPRMASLDHSHGNPGHSFGGALDQVNFQPFKPISCSSLFS